MTYARNVVMAPFNNIPKAINKKVFLSIPIGSIISAKFFGKDNRTFPLIVLGIGINGLITTGIATLIATFF